LGVRSEDPQTLLAPDHLQLLESFASEIGGALESTRMSEEIGRTEAQIERQAIDQARPDSDGRLSSLLTAEKILVVDDEMKNDELIRLLLSRLQVKNRGAALQSILNREKAGPTLIGPSVAVPHARLKELTTIQVALAVSKNGGFPLTVLFLSPASDPKMHLAFLAGLAAFFQNADHVAALSQLKSPQDVLNYIRQSEAR
jgi:PTS system nitrogen regulatory IIA component